MGWFFNKKTTSKSKFKSRAPVTRKQKLRQLAQSGNYYSVTITRCGCNAASKLIGKCFKFDEAPDLPLPDCSADECTCEYQGAICRRRGERRQGACRRNSIRMGEDRRQINRRKGERVWKQYDI